MAVSHIQPRGDRRGARECRSASQLGPSCEGRSGGGRSRPAALAPAADMPPALGGDYREGRGEATRQRPSGPLPGGLAASGRGHPRRAAPIICSRGPFSRIAQIFSVVCMPFSDPQAGERAAGKQSRIARPVVLMCPLKLKSPKDH